jgi:glycosyltransferase involved in cell wall biosynthesis
MGMSEIALSVIVPSYNDGLWLNRAVESVLSQAEAVPGLELLLIDDASTDTATRSVQDALASKHPRYVRLLRQERNGGPARARNAGIAAARGRWIAFLDGDDYWLPGGLAARWSVVNRHPDAVFIGTDYRLESESGNAESSGFNASRPRTQALLAEGVDVGEAVRLSRPVGAFVQASLCHANVVMARADLIEDVGGFSEDLYQFEDYHLWVRLAQRADFYYSPFVTAVYVTRASSLSHRLSVVSPNGGGWKGYLFEKLMADPIFAPWRPALRRRLIDEFRQEAEYFLDRGERGAAVRAAWRALRLGPLQSQNWKTMARSAFAGQR